MRSHEKQPLRYWLPLREAVCLIPIARKERKALRQHRQHRLRPYRAPPKLRANQVDCRRKRHSPNPRNVVLSEVRVDCGRC